MSEACFHCGLPVPAGADYPVTIEGQARAMCCPGCQAVAGAIVAGGLERFYQLRDAENPRPDAEPADYSAYDLPAVQEEFAQREADGRMSGQFFLDGITCAACAWLIEKQLRKLPGVSAEVNVSAHRARLVWDPEQTPLSQVLAELAAIGYRAQPAVDDAAERHLEAENRRYLKRLGVAGLGMMQVGMFATALHVGAFSGIDEQWRDFLRFVSAIVATPVVFYSAHPFFSAAWRSLRARHLVMDVPVALAIGGAYAASLMATWQGGGEVYFDSVVMFTFFLLIGRYLEFRARVKHGWALAGVGQWLPAAALRVTADGREQVSIKQLLPGDQVLVLPGATVPADGEVCQGESAVVEAALTGEPLPVAKRPGDQVAAGTINGEQALTVAVTATGASTQLAQVLQLAQQAQQHKPPLAALADRLAGYFVGAVLVVAAAVFSFWWWQAPEQAFWITLSVLVVTCPCALSLATPTALTAATHALRRHGLLVTQGHVVESLPQLDRAVFDKTGTLTAGQVQVVDLQVVSGTREQAWELAAALEADSSHPIAQAFWREDSEPVSALRQVPGGGVEGRRDGVRYRLGHPAFACANPPAPPTPGHWLLLTADNAPLAWFRLDDPVRPGAADAVAGLRARGLTPVLLSGDPSSAVTDVAAELAIDQALGGQSAAEKLAAVRQWQQQGHRVLMVGDGINDAPVLGAANVSVAMAQAADLARVRADAVLLSGDLRQLAKAVDIGRAGRRIIRQNVAWALGYNLTALPLAAMGLVPPWVAALGMSLSSLLVVGNALRLQRRS